MPKITRYGGHTNAGLTQRDAGFVDAAIVHTSMTPTLEVEDEVADTEDDVEAPFDPAGWSVKDVLAERGNCTDAEWEAVLQLEREGSARIGILGK